MTAVVPTFLSSSFGRPGRRIVAVLTVVALALTGAVVSSSQPARATGTASVSGIVTAAATTDPIAGIRVDLWESAGGGDFNYRDGGQTGSDGRYEFLGLQPGLYAIQFTDDQGGFLGRFHDGATELYEASLLTLAEGAHVTADVALGPAASISGVVTAAATTEPIAGIRVDLWESAGGGGFNYRAGGQTGSDGRYEFLGLQPGLYAIQFTDDQGGFLGRFHDGATELSEASLLTLAEGATVTANVPLDRAASISGVVTRDSDGAPLEGVLVQGQSNEGGPFLSSQARTDLAGAYTLSGLDPSRLWTIQFQGEDQGFVSEFYDDEDGFSDARRLAVSGDAPTTGIDAALQLGSTISGTVALSSDPDFPLESASVVLQNPGGSSGTYRNVYTDSLGAFSITGLPVGTYIVEASADGMFTSWWQDGATRADANAIVISSPGQVVSDVDFLLDQGGTISGTVQDIAGNPIVDVQVSAEPTVWSGSAPSARTDANGEYVLTSVASIDYRLSFTPPDGSELRHQYWPNSDTWGGAQLVRGIAGGAVTDRSIVLPQGGTVRGRVTSAQTSNPIEGIQVRVSSRQGYGFGFATTDSNGVWEVRGLIPADDYVVSFDTGQGHVGELFDNTRSWSNPTLVVVTAGGVRSGVDAALDPSAQVSGRVIDSAGTGIEGIGVNLLLGGSGLFGSGSATTGPDGRWEIADVAPGAYRVLFGNSFESVPDYRLEWHGNTYNPNDSAQITINPGVSVTGINATLAPNTRPVPPRAPTISVSGASSGSPTARVNLPTTGPAAYGFVGSAQDCCSGDGIYGTVFESGVLDLSWMSPNSQQLISAKSFGADGVSPSVQELLIFGAGPGIRSTPVVSANGATTNSLSLSWTISQSRPSVDGFRITAYPVGVPSGSSVSWDSGPTPNVHAGNALLEGLRPATTYEVFVVGVSDNSEQTFFSRGLFTTLSGVTTAPRSLVAVDATATSASMSWAVPATLNGGVVTDYRVQYRVGSTGSWLTFADAVSTRTSVTVTGLPTRGVHQVRVAAVTAFGVSAYGPAVSTLRSFIAPTPRITGTLKVANTLTATAGTWDPAAIALTYRWHRNGAAISGATSRTYKLSGLDAGALLTVKVTGSRAGFATVTKTSGSTARIVSGTLTPTSTPTVSGSAKVGSRLTANAGIWGPGTVTLSYQWNRNGSAISGATASTYVLTSSDAGRTVTVRVTGRKTGYTSASKLSSSTATVTVPIRISGDGIRLVPSEVPRTTYVTTSKTLSGLCYWETKSGFSNSSRDIVNNDIGNGQRIMEVNSLAVGVETNRCGSWVRLADIPTARKSSVPGDGVWSVQKQIVPGLYRASAGTDFCYWARSSDFTSSSGSIIDNYIGSSPRPIMRIFPDDVAFESSRCGSWTRISD